MWAGLALSEVGVLSASSADVTGFGTRCAAGGSLMTSVWGSESVTSWSCAGTGSGFRVGNAGSCIISWWSVCGSECFCGSE